MSTTSPGHPHDPRKPIRKALWVSLAFYSLVAFEFFYMASPFAAYVYAVYGPGLDWLESTGPTSWLIGFFLPHIVADTRSALVNGAPILGLVLFAGGLLAFAIGAFQIYRAKLRRHQAVTGGIYRHIRHPQYLSLMVASLGMLLIWPRFLVLALTVTVVFVYIALARAEESLCLGRFPGYAEYMQRTGMFLPRALLPRVAIGFPQGRWLRLGLWVLAYLSALGAAMLLAFGLRSHAIGQLYTGSSGNALFLSVTALPERDIARIASIARSSADAQASFAALGSEVRLLAYVVPTAMYISEVPMQLPAGARFGHSVPRNRDPSLYKVIFTVAEFRGRTPVPADPRMLQHVVNKRPLVEVHVNLATGRVVATLPPPKTAYYGGRQVPVF
jgi:protein-S-isoprenylcysteine O-methyltransferase Ste14